ncbi:MAG: hypothetical protein IPL32_08485 [Chloracidobacterium sp.]|nr:hypothetical protein [Chloracidobacterium sp.]
MLRLCWQFLIALLVLSGCPAVYAQTASKTTGSLVINGRAKTTSKTVVLKKKRFYLFRGDREANRTLIENLKAANLPSRDCFYCQLKASAEFMQWLKAGDGNCESIHCREISQEDITNVPEFQIAFQKGTKPFAKKPELARKWLVTNLEPGFRTGLYDARKAMIDGLLKDLPAERLPVQSAMTDNSSSALANFSSIPLTAATEKFIFANLVPVEIGEKSYVWICEVDIGKDKKTPILDAPESSKIIKKCEVIVRDLPDCKAGTCDQK